MSGLRYVRSRPDLRAILLMVFMIGTFGLNFPIFISAMSVKVFHGGADQYGFLTSVIAVGTLAGALLAAGREKPRFGLLLVGAAIVGIGFVFAAITPNVWLFAVALVVGFLGGLGEVQLDRLIEIGNIIIVWTGHRLGLALAFRLA